MTNQKIIWRVIVPIVIIAAVLAMTFGVACHSHGNCTAGTCPLCHLVIAPSVDGIGAYVLIPVGAGPEAPSARLVAGTAPRQIPARAPPA